MSDSQKATNLRQQLRQHYRRCRRALSPVQQAAAAQQLLLQCQSHPGINQAQHIALYLANDGELDTAPVIQWLWQQQKYVYLPVVHPFSQGHLLFLRYTATTPLIANRYHIMEPRLDVRWVIPRSQLDIICTPLVAFDEQGQRLGMGGGYYDRTLAPWFDRQSGPRPIGLAHDCQLSGPLPNAPWDVPLPEIITPQARYHY